MPSKKITTDVFDNQGKKVKQVELNSKIFGVEVKSDVVHQVAVSLMGNARTNLAHTKDRSEVRGGGRKPWRQKGTGNARHGSRRSPIWVGGGVTFGPTKDRNFTSKINKKVKTKATYMCLSDKVQSNWLVLLDKLELKGKTKEAASLIEAFKTLLDLQKIKNKTKQEGKEKKFDIKDYKLSILIVVADKNKDAFKSARNLPGVKIVSANSLNVLDLLKYKYFLAEEGALKVIENTFLKKERQEK